MFFSYLGFDPFCTGKKKNNTDVFDTKTAAGRDPMQNRWHVARILRAAKSAIQDACLASIFLFFSSFLSKGSEELLLFCCSHTSCIFWHVPGTKTHTIALHKTECALYNTIPAFSGSCQPSMPGSIYCNCQISKQSESKCNPSN